MIEDPKRYASPTLLAEMRKKKPGYFADLIDRMLYDADTKDGHFVCPGRFYSPNTPGDYADAKKTLRAIHDYLEALAFVAVAERREEWIGEDEKKFHASK